jgi:hypothetical protein
VFVRGWLVGWSVGRCQWARTCGCEVIMAARVAYSSRKVRSSRVMTGGEGQVGINVVFRTYCCRVSSVSFGVHSSLGLTKQRLRTSSALLSVASITSRDELPYIVPKKLHRSALDSSDAGNMSDDWNSQ